MNRTISLLNSLVILFFILLSCSNEPAKERQHTEKKRIEFPEEFKKLAVFENYVQKVEKNKNLDRIQSLFYTDSEGNTTEAIAWINNKMEIVKMKQTETQTNGKKTEQTFYFLNGLKSVSQQVVYHYEKKHPIFTEKRSYYSLTGAVIATFERTATTENLSSVELENGVKEMLDHQKCLAIVKRTGDFETRFRGFDEAFGRKYIVLGTDHQTTTVAFNVESPILKQLLQSESSYKNKRMDVQFSPITEPDGFSFQALVSLDFSS
ncbi:MAG: hypothetical protein ACKOXP_03035 [Flavobacteriales bacterium]